ncbi:hypothetical protein [Novipirellula aureliae]|uniref:hypothetical protein n=1 Tax=Novipirellula aureliae TaxID=2527966 RepID=UPI0011B7D294|nr:hypothetical protein [Novipirellula aureliae]
MSTILDRQQWDGGRMSGIDWTTATGATFDIRSSQTKEFGGHLDNAGMVNQTASHSTLGSTSVANLSTSTWKLTRASTSLTRCPLIGQAARAGH